MELSLNSKKIWTLLISKKHHHTPSHSIHINHEQHSNLTKFFQFLDHTITKDLPWWEHILNKCRIVPSLQNYEILQSPTISSYTLQSSGEAWNKMKYCFHLGCAVAAFIDIIDQIQKRVIWLSSMMLQTYSIFFTCSCTISSHCHFYYNSLCPLELTGFLPSSTQACLFYKSLLLTSSLLCPTSQLLHLSLHSVPLFQNIIFLEFLPYSYLFWKCWFTMVKEHHRQQSHRS